MLCSGMSGPGAESGRSPCSRLRARAEARVSPKRMAPHIITQNAMITRINPSTGQVHRLPVARSVGATRIAVARNGGKFALRLEDGTIEVWEQKRSACWPRSELICELSRLAFSPGGTLASISQHDRDVTLWDLDRGMRRLSDLPPASSLLASRTHPMALHWPWVWDRSRIWQRFRSFRRQRLRLVPNAAIETVSLSVLVLAKTITSTACRPDVWFPTRRFRPFLSPSLFSRRRSLQRHRPDVWFPT